MNNITLLFFICFVSNVFAQKTDKTQVWEDLLTKHVSENGMVNYKEFKQDVHLLDEYLNYLAEIELEKTSRDFRKATYINAYNAYTIKLILNNYPLKSINDIEKPWDIQFCQLAGKTYSLNTIEHDILRKIFNDPRIHVGVNCASISCPPLPSVAFTESNINSLLQTSMKQFINNGERNKISTSQLVQLSKIFDWFKEDFTKNGSLIDYLNEYSTQKIASDAKVEYLEYNWNLNEQ